MPKTSLSQADIDNLIAQIECAPDATLEALQSQHDHERELACKELDRMAKLFAREDEERKKLWGAKFPRVLGQKPEDFNPVKKRAKKKRK